MLKAIDHLVIVVRDLDAAVASYGELGFTVVRGGRHPSIGTHNALIAFADGAYFELIAFQVPKSTHWWRSALERGGGLIDFCMETGDLAADVAVLRRAGVKIADPWPMGRKRPDGYELRWVLATPESPHSGVVPFLIKDETPRDERVPRERTHRNGAAGIVRLTIAVEDARAACAYYTGVVSSNVTAVERSELGAAVARLMAGPHELEFIAPASPAGSIAQWLRARGPSPFEVTLSADAGHPTLLDRAKSQGARIQLC
jgi:catechol 2,3-dioxygenase-like lactoylglutathione lyase family enzyme